MAGSADEIEWIYLNLCADDAAQVGDLVSAEAGGLPIYRIMSLQDGRAWIRDLRDGSDRVTPLAAFHWKALPSAPA